MPADVNEPRTATVAHCPKCGEILTAGLPRMLSEFLADLNAFCDRHAETCDAVAMCGLPITFELELRQK